MKQSFYVINIPSVAVNIYILIVKYIYKRKCDKTYRYKKYLPVYYIL